MLTITGTMKQDVKLLSTPLSLKKGQRVYLTFPDNQPNPVGKWFARPLDGIWADGIERSDEDSILLDPGDAAPDEISQKALQQIHSNQDMTIYFPVVLDEGERQLAVNITDEGIICDVIDGGTIINSWSATAQEISDMTQGHRLGPEMDEAVRRDEKRGLYPGLDDPCN